MLAEPTSPTARRSQCKWWNSKKGYGFITNSAGEDFFCHVTAIQRAGYDNLVEGDVIAFDIAPGRGGKQMAINVSVATRSV